MKYEINLLSPQAKADRIGRMKMKVIHALMNAVIVCLVFIACSYAIGYWALSAIERSVVQRALSHEAGRAEIERAIRDIQNTIAAVDTKVSQSTAWSPLIPDIVTALPAGVRITSIELKESPPTISVVAKATAGSAVLQYQRALEALPWVGNVVAPLQNFAVYPNAAAVFTISRKEAPL